MTKLLLAGSLLALASGGPAEAASYVWGYDDSVVSASGTITTTDSATDPVTITGITGFYDGNAITALLPPGSFGGNNNLLYPKSQFYLDTWGFSFIANGVDENIYRFSEDLYSSFSDGQLGSFSLRDVSGGVPEPSTWAMLLIGFFAVGGVMRSPKRRQKLGVSFA